jgi:hypothetical protein
MKFAAVYKRYLDRASHLTESVVRYAPPPGDDPSGLRANLAGLLCTAYVAAFECSIKEILTTFASETHSVLGNFVAHNMDRINGRIKIDNISRDYIRPFGDKYEAKFKELIKTTEDTILIQNRKSVRNCYENIISWRNDFAHNGQHLASFEETCDAFPIAAHVILQIDATMSI